MACTAPSPVSNSGVCEEVCSIVLSVIPVAPGGNPELKRPARTLAALKTKRNSYKDLMPIGTAGFEPAAP